MWNAIKELVIEVLTSKKALAMLASLATIGANKAGLDMEPDTVKGVVGSLWAYMLGQGIADIGKPAAKVKAKHSSAADAFGATPIGGGK